MGEYVGPSTCAHCHSEIAASQKKTPMFQAASLARNSAIPGAGHDLKFSDDAYSYVVSRTPNGVTISAKNQTESISADVGWAFGASDSSQTYVLKRGETFIESRLSYFQSLLGLDTERYESLKSRKVI